MQTEQEILQRRMSKFLVGEVFNTVSDEDIFSQNTSGKWTYKGNEMAQGQIDAIKKEAKAMSKMGVYTMLIDEVRYHARKGLDKAETEADIISAKLLSYFCDVVTSKLKKLSEL